MGTTLNFHLFDAGAYDDDRAQADMSLHHVLLVDKDIFIVLKTKRFYHTSSQTCLMRSLIMLRGKTYCIDYLDVYSAHITPLEKQ